MEAVIRSRKQIEIDRLSVLLDDVQRHGYLGVGTEEYRGPADAAWRAGRGAREAAVQEVADAIRRAIEMVPEDAVLRGGSLDEVRYYLHAAGVQTRAWYERFEEFGPVVTAGMGGFRWWHAPEGEITREQAAALARVDVAQLGPDQPSHRYHRDDRIFHRALSPGVEPHSAALFLERGEEIPLWMQDTEARDSTDIDPERARRRLEKQSGR